MGKKRRFWFDLLQEKRQVLRSDKEVERLDDRREARAEGGRRFQREGAIMAKDLDMAMVVLYLLKPFVNPFAGCRLLSATLRGCPFPAQDPFISSSSRGKPVSIRHGWNPDRSVLLPLIERKEGEDQSLKQLCLRGRYRHETLAT